MSLGIRRSRPKHEVAPRYCGRSSLQLRVVSPDPVEQVRRDLVSRKCIRTARLSQNTAWPAPKPARCASGKHRRCSRQSFENQPMSPLPHTNAILTSLSRRTTCMLSFVGIAATSLAVLPSNRIFRRHFSIRCWRASPQYSRHRSLRPRLVVQTPADSCMYASLFFHMRGTPYLQAVC